MPAMTVATPVAIATPPLRLLFWETTKACNLECKHCRAVPQKGLGPLDLTTPEAFAMMDGIAAIAKPVFILSGGEPLYRPDIFDLASYGKRSDSGWRSRPTVRSSMKG
jgi:MoaA/NifB/PqqE/SkfB family radical SAM enzyme